MSRLAQGRTGSRRRILGLSYSRSQDVISTDWCSMTNEGRPKIFNLGNIQAVVLRCTGCRTAVSFPRIRWANFPESCPNCGAGWMRKPAVDGTLAEDVSVGAFRAIRTFREALQALIGMGHAAGFIVGLELSDVPDKAETSEPASKGNGSDKLST